MVIDVPVGSAALARVIKAVLTAGCTVQIQDDLDVVFSCPSDRAVEVLRLSLQVRFSPRHIVRPEPDRDSDVVQPSLCLSAL
jgi:hypothetical protein